MVVAAANKRIKIASPAASTQETARRRRPLLALAAILALAAMVRGQHLADVGYTFDEAFCWKMTTFPIGEIWRRAALDNHPPLYFYLLRGWSAVWGEAPQALRSLSVVLGLVTVVGAYLLVRLSVANALGGVSRASHSELPALAAAALLALSPFQIEWSQQVRMYVLGAALTLISSWLLLRVIHAVKPRWQDFAWYALAATALAYTHYFGLFVLAGQFLYAVGCVVERNLFRSKIRGQFNEGERIEFRSTTMAIAFASVGLLWLPWAPHFFEHRRQVSRLFHTRQFNGHEAARACFAMFAAGSEGGPPGPLMMWAAVAGCLLAAMAMLLWGRGGLRLIGLCVLVTFDGAICASLADRNIFSTRYFLFAHALLLCGVPALVAQTKRRDPWGNRPTSPRSGDLRRSPHRMWQVLALAALVAGMGWLCLAHVARRDVQAARPGMMAAMAYLAEVRRPDEPILVSNPMVQIAAAAHATKSEQVRVLGESASFPYFQGTAVMRPEEYLPPRDLDALSCRRVWAIDALGCFAGTWSVRLPERWIDVSEEVFPEQPSPTSRIVVRCYERRKDLP